VALEHRLSREQFLSETCAKAGLPAMPWKDPETKLQGFQCEIIAEGRGPASGKKKARANRESAGLKEKLKRNYSIST